MAAAKPTAGGDSKSSKSATAAAAAAKQQQLLFSFGLIADIQYANQKIGRSGWGKRRYYHDALNKIDKACTAFAAAGCAFILDLGDLVDQKQSETALATVLTRLTDGVKNTIPVFHVIGNHDLYKLTREYVTARIVPRAAPDGLTFSDLQTLAPCIGPAATPTATPTATDNKSAAVTVTAAVSTATNDSKSSTAAAAASAVPIVELSHATPAAAAASTASTPQPPTVAYYHLSPRAGYRFIALDSYDLNVLTTPINPVARAMLEAGTEAYHVRMNGGVGAAQLEWLKGVLVASVARKERIWIYTHVPLVPEVAYGPRDAVLWNCVAVMTCIHTHGATNVEGCFYGHEHEGGYHVDRYGIPHRALQAVLESKEGSTSHAIVNVYDSDSSTGSSGSGGVWEFNGSGNVRPNSKHKFRFEAAAAK